VSSPPTTPHPVASLLDLGQAVFCSHHPLVFPSLFRQLPVRVCKRFPSSGLGDAAEGALAERPCAAAFRHDSPFQVSFRSSAGSLDPIKQLRTSVIAVDSSTKKRKLRGSILGERSCDSGSASSVITSLSRHRPRIYRPHTASRSVSRSMSHTSTEDITREDGSKEMEKGGGGGMGGTAGL
jgi:hypothetical protein